MKTIIQLCYFIFLASSTTSFAAVSLSQNQTGQAVVVPYYTVANNLNTLVSINNTQNQPKAIKVHIKDGRQGAAMISFNLYLDANDVFTFAMGEGVYSPNVYSNDTSCTLNLENIPLGIPVPPNENWNILTGTIEIIEMGNVLTESNDFFGGISQQENCDRLSDAWYANGPNSFWQAESTAELSPVSGGLTADVSVIDVTDGFAFKVPTLAFENFFPADTIFNRLPESDEPNLASGTQNSLLLHQGQVFQTTWPTGYEAISALFMKSTVENEYDVEAGAAGVTEWVLSFPTMPYHKASSVTQTPFIFEDEQWFRFPGTPSNDYHMYNREGAGSFGIWACVLPPPGVYCPPINFLNHVVSTYVVDPRFIETPVSVISGGGTDSVRPLNIDGSGLNPNQFLSGKAKLLVKSDTQDEGFGQVYAITNNRGVNSSTAAAQNYLGLPVTGFSVQMYRNGNAQPGLLATYATAKMHYGERIIIEADD